MNRKYKVVHLVETLDAIGGMERIVAQIATHLNKNEFEVEIWCVHLGGRYAQELVKQGLTLRVFNISNYYNPLNILRLALELKRSEVDIVHTHMYFASTIGRCAAWIAGVKVLINHMHSSYWHYSSRNLFIERLLSKITHKIICVSKHTMDFVVTHEKIDPLKVDIVYNGISVVPTLSKLEARERFNVAPTEVIIITVANLLENKGHKVLLKALSLLETKNINIKCWIVGQGPMEEELKEYAQQLNLGSKIVFWGGRHDVPMLLSASDIFVLASIHIEGLPISILEALAYQVPVIATKVGGLPEIIEDKVSGRMVPPNDPSALASSIKELINNQGERLEYAQEGAKRFIQQFESKHMIERIEKLYQEGLKA